MFNSLKEAAAKQAAKLKEAIDEAAQQDATARTADRKQNQDTDAAEELQYLKLENEALKTRLRDSMSPASEREAKLEGLLAAKTAEHEKLAEKSRELMLRYRKLQAEKAALGSPDAKSPAPSDGTGPAPSGLQQKLSDAEDRLKAALEELETLKQRKSEVSADLVGTNEELQRLKASLSGVEGQSNNDVFGLKAEVERLVAVDKQKDLRLKDLEEELVQARDALSAKDLKEKNLAEKIVELEAALALKQQSLDESQQRVENVSSSLEDQGVRAEELSKKLEAMTAERDTLRSQHAAALNRLDEFARTAQSTEVEANSEKELRIEELDKQLKAEKIARAEIETQFHGVDTELAKLKEHSLDKDQKILQLNKEIDVLVAEKETISLELHRQQTSGQNALEDVQVERVKLQETVSSLEDAADVLQKEVAGMAEERAQLLQKLTLSESTLKQMEAAEAELRASLATSASKASELGGRSNEIHELNSEIASLRQKEVDLRTELETVERNHQLVSSELTAFKDMTSGRELELRVLLDRAERKATSVEQKLRLVMQSAPHSDDAVQNDARTQLVNMTTLLETAQAELASLRNSLAESERLRVELQTDLHVVKEAMAMKSQDFHEVHESAEFRAMQTKLETLQIELDDAITKRDEALKQVQDAQAQADISRAGGVAGEANLAKALHRVHELENLVAKGQGLEATVEELQKQVQVATTKVSSLTEVLDRERQQFHELEAQLTERCSVLEEDEKHASGILVAREQELRREIDVAGASLEALKLSVTDLSAERETLMVTVSTLQKANLQYQLQEVELRASLERTERLRAEEIAALNVQLQNKEEELLTLRKEVEESKTVELTGAEKDSLRKEVDLRVSLDRSERLHARSIQRLSELESDLEQVRKGSGNTAENNSQQELNLAAEIQSLANELIAAKEREINLRVSLDRSERIHQRASSHCQNLEAKCEGLEKVNKELIEIQNREIELRVALVQKERELAEKVKTMEAELYAANQRVNQLVAELDSARQQALSGQDDIVRKLEEKTKALEAADEMMKNIARSFDERSETEAALKRELELQTIKVEELELKLRTDFDRAKFEVQSIYDEKAKQISQKLEQAQQEAEAAHVACSGFQRQLREAHEEIAKQTRELDSLKERTRDALLRVNDEKKELQEKLSSLQVAFEKKSFENSATPAASSPIIDQSQLDKLHQEKTELEEALELSRRVTETLEAEAAALKVELEAAQGIIRSIESNEQRWVAETSKLKDELTQVRQEIRTRKDRAEKMLMEREATIEKLNYRLEQLQDPESMRATLEEEEVLREENRDLHAQLEAKREEIERLAQDVASYKQKLADYLHRVPVVTPSRNSEDPAGIYLKNVLISFMSSRDPREQLGMVKAISQLAGFTPLETEKIKHVLEDADRGVLGKLVGSVLTLGTTDPATSSPATPARVMKKV